MKININQDLFIVLTVVLVALIFFGIGRLTSPKSEPIQIMNLEKALPSSLRSEEGGQASVEGVKTDYQGKVLGSKNSEKYRTITEI